jgi:hypothetical protein
MSELETVQHRFLERIPELLEDGVLYVSIEFCVALHRCCCGCGSEVVTPLSPTDWQLTFNGESVTLYPSIGNWSLPCRSHYWIRNNHVTWAEAWSEEKIIAGRRVDRVRKEQYFSVAPDGSGSGSRIHAHDAEQKRRNSAVTAARRWWLRLRQRFVGR